MYIITLLLINLSLSYSLSIPYMCNKVAIITGGTRGIGLGIAKSFSQKNYDLLLTYNNNKEKALETKKHLEYVYDNKVELISGDLALKKNRKQIFDYYDKVFDNSTYQLSAVVHNAGQYIGLTSDNYKNFKSNTTMIFGDGSMLVNDELITDKMDYYLQLYGISYIDICERAIKRMKNGGSLIGISSPGCNLLYKPAVPNLKTGYDLPGTGKTIMEYSMRYIARRTGYKNINCNIIVPGPVNTDAFDIMIKTLCEMIGGNLGIKFYKKIKVFIKNYFDNSLPMGILEPTQLGEVITFLCSDSGRVINGVIIPVDGGNHLK